MRVLRSTGRVLVTLRPTALALAVVLCLTTGCVRRRIIVNSNPSGARVYFDGRYKGTTPVEFPFKWYGGHTLRLERDRYDDSVEVVELRAPLYLKVPIDFFSELVPFSVQDTKEYQVRLEPKTAQPDIDDASGGRLP